MIEHNEIIVLRQIKVALSIEALFSEIEKDASVFLCDTSPLPISVL